MRPIYTLFAGAALLFCSCSSSHKVQNSEDPGYSSGSSKSASSAGQSDYYSTAPSDNYVRMRTTTDDPRWSQFDDNNSYDNYYAYTPTAVSPYSYGFGYSPYSYGYGMYGGYTAMSMGMGFWDPYFGWNSYFMWNMGYNPYFYNPYYGGGVLIIQQPGYYAPGTSPATSVSSHVYSNLTAFNPSTYRGGNFASRSGRSFGNGRSGFSSPSNSNSGSGRSFNNSSTNNNRPTYTPRNTGGNSSGGGVFGGGSSSGGRSFGGGNSGSFGGGSGGGSFGGRGGFRH